jgi:ActR/RegA family two-component response regulator
VSDGERGALRVVAVVSDQDTVTLLGRTLAGSGDQLSVATDLAEGLTRVSSHVPEVAFVDVAEGKNAGLAVLHHVRALAPGVPVYALLRPDRLELGPQAIALGAAGVLVLPLTGDDILTTLAEVRTRLAEKDLYRELQKSAHAARLESELFARVAELADCETRREAAGRLVGALATAGSRRTIVYLPASEGQRQLLRAASSEGAPEGPAFCEEIELNAFAEEQGLEVVRLALKRELGGIVLTDRLLQSLGPDVRETAMSALTAQGATLLSLIGAREEARRGGMKDPRSSAYTFAYFVDVAGREIDMARRHRRRFALATIGVHPRREERPDAMEPTLATVEGVLGAVRDTDVLARVDANEFYLLLPETGGLGAHACRRRVLDRLAAAGATTDYDVGVGVAVYPHDGGDLSRLLRMARHRSEICRVSVVSTLGLANMTLAGMVDTLLARPAIHESNAALLEAPRTIELPMTDVAGLIGAGIREAQRGGPIVAAVTRRAGVGIGGALGGEAGRDGDDRRVQAVDVSQAPGCANVEACAVIAEQGAYALIGRSEGHVVRAVHASDPVLVDLLVQRLGEAAGVRLFD